MKPSTKIFTHTLTPLHPYDHSEHTIQMNEAESVERDCSWYQSAILVESVSARMEKCTFSNMNDGALSVALASTLTLTDVTFEWELDDTPT